MTQYMRAALFLFFVPLFIGSACSNRPSNPSQAVQSNRQAKRELGQFTCLPGTSYQMAPIQSRNEGGFSSSYESYTHNYVFLNAASVSFIKLLDSNSFLITSTLQFPNLGSDLPLYEATPRLKCEPDNERVKWLLYTVVKEDTNQDKRLSAEDFKTLAVSDASGQGYTELISNVQKLYGQAFQPETERLIVIYRSDNTNQVSVIDLPARKVVSTKPLIDLGSDIE